MKTNYLQPNYYFELKNNTFAGYMKKRVFLFFALIVAISISSCKSEFERIRTNPNPDIIYDKSMDYYKKGDFEKAQILMEQILGNFKGRSKAEPLYFNFANTHYQLGNFISSAGYFKYFSQTFPTSNNREEADFMTAMSYYKMSPNYRLEQTNSEKAIDEFQIFVNTHPKSTRIDDCNKKIDELRAKLEQKAYEEGVLYYDLKNYQSAVQSFENLLKDFPETRHAEKVRYMILKASFLYAENSIYEKQADRYQAAMKKYDDFKNKYPKSKYDNEIKEMVVISQNKLKTFKDVRY